MTFDPFTFDPFAPDPEPPPEPKVDMVKELAKADLLTKYDFRQFVKMVFYTLNPGIQLKWSWHLEYLCWLATRTFPLELNPVKDPTQRLTRIIINVPPRSLKSETFSVALTCFLQGHYPSEKILCGSSALSLAEDLHGKAKRIMESPWYTRIFPATKLEYSTKTLWKTTDGGHRRALTVGGTTTGFGGNYLIADDIMSVGMATSEAERKAANHWFDQSFMTRRNDPESAVVIVIMQRLHQDDTTGHILHKDKSTRWYHVKIPLIFPATQTFKMYGTTITKEAGDLLLPDRWSHETVQELKEAMVPTEFAGQYLQEPVPDTGVIFDTTKIQDHTEDDLPPYNAPGTRIVQSWDCASKTGSNNDYSVCQTWFYTPTANHLVDQLRFKAEYPELKRIAIEQAAKWNPNTILIEDKNNGTSLLQDLGNETMLPIKAVNPVKSKVDRAAAVSPLVEAGRISVDSTLPTYNDFIMECRFFPNGRNDDMVDAMTQYLDWVRAQQHVAKVRVTAL